MKLLKLEKRSTHNRESKSERNIDKISCKETYIEAGFFSTRSHNVKRAINECFAQI